MKHPSVLAPVRPLISAWLGPGKARYSNKSVAKAILASLPAKLPDLDEWISAIKCTGPNSSEQLWSWRKVEIIAKENQSKEKILEKLVASLLGGPAWANQVNTASGLSRSSGDGRRNIDLIQKTPGGGYRFVELKISSNNPVYAAIELVEYTLLYLWIRAHPEKQKRGREDKELLSARRIALVVLAPEGFYGEYDPIELRRFADLISTAFERLKGNVPLVNLGFFVLPQLPKTPDQEALEAAFANPRAI